MSAPPTTRASRSRYASPAVGAGTRSSNTKDCTSREKSKGPGVKDKDRGSNKNNAARPSRSTSMERSRRFMENWIEPERARLTSFQEDGLIRQGVLETMEPLGTRPKPAIIKKLVGIGREASPTFSARGKLGGKKIVLKRKPGNGGGAMPSSSAAPEPLSGTQSPTPVSSTTAATPQTAVSPIVTPTLAISPQASPQLLPQNSSPGQARNAPIVPVPSSDLASEQQSLSTTLLPDSAIPSLPPTALSTSLTGTFLPDPVKQSIEGPQPLPTTPRSIADSYDAHDDSGRESSLQSNVPPKQQAPRRTGPIYIASELARILEHKEVVKTAIEKGVEEALRHFQYVDAWALQFMYEDKEEDARFLLLTEAVFTQTATPQALGEWARELHAFKVLGMKGNAAVRHFVPEARMEKNYKPPKAQPAEYGDLVTMDMSQVRDPTTYKQERSGAGRQPEGGVSRTEAEAEAEHERVATPPRKRQKISSRDSPMARKASSSARASAMKGHGNGGNTANESPLRHRQRLLSQDSDLSSLSSLESLSPSPEPASWTRAVNKKTSQQAAVGDIGDDDDDEVQTMQQHSEAGDGVVAEAPVTNGTNKAYAAPDEAATPAQPIASGRRRAPARAQARRGGPGLAVPRPSPGGPNFTSKAKAKPISNLESRNLSPDSLHSTNNDDTITTTTNNNNINNHSSSTTNQQAHQPSKRSKRGMPNFEPQYRLEEGDEGTVRRRMARNTTLRLTEQARIKGDSFARATPIDAPSPPERPASSQSSLSSLSALEDEGGFDELPPEVVAPVARVAPSSARATRSAKRTHDDAEDEATPFSLDFAVPMSTVATSSRAGTPRPNKKQRTGGRRLKLSPTKNKAAPSAGMPRGASRASPSVNGVLANQEENDDFCSSCGGNGSLVCCDGCTRAFHQLCHDPIVDPNDDSEWFCHDCSIKRDPSKVGEYSGPFGDLMTNLDKRGATSYRLPKRVREYFEGVRTGVDGEYEDYVPPIKGKKRKEDPKPQEEDLYTIVDKENRPIFCHSCQRSAASNRPMMPCSICGLHWHMDCLDPPRPHLPNPRTFVCPCHIDDLLLRVPAQMGPAHKFRKIKGSSEIAYVYRRGNTNNGWVEVEDDEPEGESCLNFQDPASYGRVYKLRSSGIKEDFIFKLSGGRHTQKSRPSEPSPPPPLYFRNDAEDIYEAARDLVAFSRATRDLDVPPPVDAISDASMATAGDEDLEELQAEVARLNAKIKAQLQKARGQQSTYTQLLGNHQYSSATPGANGHNVEDDQATTSTRNGVETDDKTNTETSSTEPPSMSLIKAEQSPGPHMPLDSALTPVSDLVKDSDMPLPPTSKSGAKINSSGIETPEFNITDQQTSLAKAGDMVLD